MRGADGLDRFPEDIDGEGDAFSLASKRPPHLCPVV